MSAFRLLGCLGLCAVLGLNGCTSKDASEPVQSASPTASAEPSPARTTASATACTNAEQVLNTVTAPPDGTQAALMAEELDAIAAEAPEDVAGPISALSTALLSAATTPDGFSGTSPASRDFDEALQTMGRACAEAQLGS